MQITVRKSVKIEANKLINNALHWMKAKYPTVNFTNIEFIVSGAANRSRYFRNEVENAKYKLPVVFVCTRATLILYDKKSLGIKKNSLFVGSVVQTMCALIHELTHHVQYEKNERKGNELDTTANELEYLKENHTNFYNKVLKIK